MKKILSLTLILSLLGCSNAYFLETSASNNSPYSEKSKAIQKSNQRTERKGLKNGSLK